MSCSGIYKKEKNQRCEKNKKDKILTSPFKLKQGISSFAEMNQQEQAAIIEREVYYMQQSRDMMLSEFNRL